MKPHSGSHNPRLAFVFPGQGSQSVGMLAELAREFPVVERTFSEASAALGYDLWQLVSEGPEERLNQTEVTQPAILAAGVAVWRVWREQGGPAPACMAGHSLGEYSALACAESLSFADAVRLVADRGRFMQQAVPAGMGAVAAVIGLDDAAVSALCAEAAEGEVLAAVNHNCPGQVVIAGGAQAVQRAIVQAKSAGAKRAVLLPVSVPVHCTLMHPAAERLAERLRSIAVHTPRIVVLHNAHLRSETDPDGIRAALVRQIESPVPWVAMIRKIAAGGVDTFVECGPGKVLSGLNKRILESATALAVHSPESLRAALATLD